MGCGGSKPVQQAPIEIITRIQTRERASDRALIRPGTATGTRMSQKTKTTSSSGTTRTHSYTWKASSRNQTLAIRYQIANRPQSRLMLSDEQPSDVAISDAVRDLAAVIEGHSLNYYPRTNAFAVGKDIGHSIVNFAIMGDDNVFSITNRISDKVQKYQPYDSADREAHLQSLVEEGRRIHDTIEQHRDDWSFGHWDEGIKFPALLKNGTQVNQPRH